MRVIAAIVILIAGSAAAPAASLRNDGFESGNLDNWARTGEGWRPSSFFRDSRRGIYAAVNDVCTNALDTYRVIYQELKVSPGKDYQASVWLRAVCLEASESFLEIQFLDKGGSVLGQHQSPHVDRDQDFVQMVIERMTAPAEAARASVRGVVHVIGRPEINTDYHVFDNFDFRPVREPEDGAKK